MAGEIQLNSVSLATESGGTVSLNSSTDIKGCINASGSAPIYACRAWINFDGTSASIGTGRANGNVSGVADNGIGDYTVTFATAMPDANYVFTEGRNSANTGGISVCTYSDATRLAASLRLLSVSGGNSVADSSTCLIAIFR